MKGGLLQLATVGKEDSVLINNPQIFFFKKVYKKHTNFSIDSNQMILGEKKLDTKFEMYLRKDGDLLKDLLFYVEIPYFEILKKIESTNIQFNRTESDKVYYKYLNMKSLVFFTDSDNFYIIPENVLYLNNEVRNINVDSLNIISINSKEYLKYFNKSSTLNEIVIKESRLHQSIKYLKTIDSFWFNNLINNLEDQNSNFKISLVDLKKFSIWFNKSMENRLFLNYQNLFNTNKLKNKYQINFNDNRNINEIKKLFEIKGKFDTLTEDNYFDENLDIDKAIISNFKSKNLDFNYDNMEEYILQTIKYPSRFIKYILSKLYDNNIDNFFTFYNMYKVGYTVDNDIITKNSNNYDNSTWDDYISNNFKKNFDNISSNVFTSGFFNSFIMSSNNIEKKIDNLWTTFNLSYNNLKIIFSILYTFIDRYENFNLYENINFLDFFESSDDDSFFSRLKGNISNYSDINETNLETINSKYGSKFDLTLIYNYFIYNLAYKINELKVFEQFNNISKQNIQFIYWLRNKISNSIFLRYKRIQSKVSSNGSNFYPNFDNIKEENELINIFYTFIPNNIISLDEIKREIYRVFNSYSYIGNITNDYNLSTSYKQLSYVTSISNQDYDKNLNGTIDFQYKISVDVTDYTQSDSTISFNSFTNKIRKSFFDDRFSLKIIYQNNYYDVEATYSNGITSLTLNSNLTLSDSFDLLVTLYMPICKYYFDYTPLTINKDEITFDTNNDNRTFYIDKYIETTEFTFQLESEPKEVISYLNLLTESSSTEGNEHSFVLNDNYYIDNNLLTEDNIANYTIKIYQLTDYKNNDILTNFELSQELINDVQKNILQINTDDFFTLDSSNLYDIQYNSTKYRVTFALVSGSTTQYVISGDLSNEIFTASSTSYYITEYSSVVNSVSSFTLTGTYIDSSEITHSTTDKTLFKYFGTTLDSSYNLIYQNDRYYQVDISNVDSDSKYQINNIDFTLEDEFSIVTGYRLTFTDSTNLSTSTDYYLSFSNNTTSQSLSISIRPVLTDGSNFIADSKKFNYLIESIDNATYSNLITDDSLTFTIKGNNNLIDNYPLFSKYLNSDTSQNFITLNKINGNIFNFEFLDNRTYFLIITYVNSNVEKRKIVIDEKTSLNHIKLQQISYDRYFIDEKINFSDILDISIQSVSNFYKDIEFNASVIIDTDRHFYLNIDIDISSNKENYYKYVNGTTSTYYLIYNSTLINLGSPDVSSDELKFKILNPENNFTSDLSSTTYNIRVFVNDYLPNLVNFTSFYILDNDTKCYDLMDYFIQTPMIIFLDNNTVKNSDIILYNFPVDVNNTDVINYLKFDNQYLHLRESINSNQLLRFDSNLISSVFDFNIISFDNSNVGGRYYEKEQLINEIENSISKILQIHDIESIINLIENTNNYAINILQTYGIKSISNGIYGKTIKDILNIFNQLNISNLLNEDDSKKIINSSDQIIDTNLKYDVLNNFNYYDFNLYSKMVVDFYLSDSLNNVSYDNELELSITSNSGKNLFVTNYKPLLLENRLNSDMLNYLTNYKNEMEKQITYVNNNLSWLKLGNEEVNNNFGYFYDFQEYFKDYLYDNSSYSYEYSYISKNSFDKYPELQKTSILNENIVINQDTIITSNEILKPVKNIITSSYKKNINSNYNYEKNKFNYIGPAIIYNGELKKDTINLSLEDDTTYMFINDCSNCYLAENLSEYEFEISDKNNKLLINSKLKKINDENVDLDVSDVNIFIYELNINDKTDLSSSDYLLINNQLCQVFSLNFNDTSNIGIYSYQSLDFTYPNFYVGTLKSDSDFDTSNLILQNNMVNLIDFSNNKVEFQKVNNIIRLNKLVSSYDSSKEYCSLKYGILKFYCINNQYFTFILDNQIYELGDTILENKPLKLHNKKISYHNISKTLTKDSYIYNENIISKLGDMSDLSNPENIWFLDGNIEDILIKFNYQVDFSNNDIYTTQEIFNQITESFLFFNDKFYKVSDFSLNDTSDNDDSYKIIYYLNNNSYDNFNGFDLIPGRTYRFNTNNENNEDNQFNFSTISDGSHNSGTIYSNGVTINGELGKPNSYIQIDLSDISNTDETLYYFSESTSGMGGKFNFSRGLTEIEVKISELDGNNIFYLDGKTSIELEAGKKYYFNTSDISNSSHTFRFSTTENGTHNDDGTEYTTDVSYDQILESYGSYTEIIAPFDLSEIYFYCSNHTDMGNKITINNSIINVEVDVALKPSTFLVNQNSFSGQKDFYCITLLENDSLNYNPLKNNTDTTFTTNNYFDISDVQYYLVNNNGKYNYNINLLFDNAIRPIEIQLCDSDNEVNKLKYKLFRDCSFVNEIDSIYDISENQISETNTLNYDKNFYLQFDVSDSIVISQENGFNKYFLNKEKVSYVKINPINNNILVETLDISSSQFKFTISSGTELYKKNFYKYDFNVTFIYDSVEYNFRLVVRVVVDDNYTLILEESYDTDSYSLLQEPYIINDLSSCKNKLRDVSDTTFEGCIPDLFQTSDNIILLINNSIDFSGVKSYNKYIDYMQVDEQTDGIYQEIKSSNVSNMNDKINYYDIIGKISIQENKIVIDESYSKIIDLVQNLIIKVDDKPYYVNIESKVNEIIYIDYNFETEITEGIVYFNLADSKYVNRSISINQELGIILTEFGGLRIGEIIEINDVILSITNYDQEFKGYTFNIISNHEINYINSYYKSYFSIGMINNLNKKYSLVNLKQKNLLISKKNENITNGDLVINNKNIIFYDNNISNLNEDTINYCFNHDGFDIFFYKLNDEWYFFGNDLGNNFKVVATYNNNQTKILEIEYIFKNKIIWKEDYTEVLSNLSISINNKYHFYYPYQPFEVKYLELKNNCSTNFSGNAVIEINNSYYLINNGLVTNFDKKIISGYYQIIPFEYTESEFSNYNVKVYPFQKVNFDNIDFYHSEDIYYNGVDYVKDNLVDSSFNIDLEFYYFDGTNYQYPLYLKQTSYLQSSILINNVKFYYTNLTESSIEPNSSLNLTDWNNYYNLIFYIIKDEKYFYPLYLDLDKLSTSSENNTTKNIEIPCNIIEKNPIINITSTPMTNSYVGESYYYQITTNPSNCDIIAENLPFWLTLNGSTGNYSISGVPQNVDKTDNDVILIAKNNNSSSLQHFQINVADDSTSFNFTTNPKTYVNVGEEYNYDISASTNLQSIDIISKPTWLSFSNNTLSGYPLFDHVGSNIIIIEAVDTSNVTITQKFDILVNNTYPPFISTNPITNIGHSEKYSYNLEINNNNNDNVTLSAKYLPTWLNLIGNTLTGTSPSTNEEHDVIIEVFKNNLKSVQSFKISVSDVSNIEFTSNPITYCFNYNEYKYQLTTNNNDNISTIEFVKKPDWISIDENNIIRGTPNNCFLKNNNVEIKVTDKDGYSILQNYDIYVFNNQDKIIKINDGIYQNILYDLNLDYFTTVLINSSYYNLNKIINFKNYSEIFVNKYIDISGNCSIIFPLNINSKRNESINQHIVNITDEIINYRYDTALSSTNSSIICYYYNDNSDQLQVRIFNILLYSELAFDIIDDDFVNFYNEKSSIRIYLENYFEIIITDIVDVKYNFKILPFEIRYGSKILIEEIKNDKKFIHYLKVVLENGILKLEEDISNDDSLFFINKIIPIKIIDKIIQFVNPIIKQNNYYGVNSREYIENWMAIPINIINKPIMVDNKWKLEIESKYLNLLNRYEIFNNLKNNTSFYKIEFVNENEKNYLIYSNLPEINNKVVFVKKIDYFSLLSKIYNNYKSDIIADDKNLEILLSDQWKLSSENIIIPMTISDGNRNNEYVINSGFEEENINLNDSDINYYLDNDYNKILLSGLDKNYQLQVITKNEITNTSVEMYIEKSRNKIINDDSNELSSSVNTIFDVFLKNNINNSFSFNTSKSLLNWTSISFYDNISYKNMNMIFKKNFISDSSGNVSLENNSNDSIFLYEEVQLTSNLSSKISLLSVDNFKNYEVLVELREIENIIYKFIKENSNKIYFWDNPIDKINQYLIKYSGNSEVNKYLITKNCLVKNDEDINDESKFEIVNENLYRLAYLDNQFDIIKNEDNIKVYRSQTKIKKVIDDIISNIDNYYSGVDSHLVFQKISEITIDKKTFFDYIIEGESFNFSYNVLTLEKLLISKQWENSKNNIELNYLFNKEFNDSLTITYDNIDSEILTGSLESSLENLKFGIESYNKIINYNSNPENIILESYKVSSDNYNDKEQIEYKIVSDNLFNYEIVSSSDILFDPELDYYIDILEGSNILVSEKLQVDKTYLNKLNFSSNISYNDYNNISLLIKKDYSINNSTFNGYLYQNVFVSDLSSGDIFIKFNSNYLDIDSYEVDSSGIFLNILSTIKIYNEDFLKIEKRVSFKSQETKIIDTETRNYLTFSKNFYTSNFSNIQSDIYLDYNNNSFKINKDSSGFFYITQTDIDLINDYNVFFYINELFESRITSQLIYDLELNENLKNINYKNLDPLPSNYKVDNVNVNDFKIINENLIQISMNEELNNPSNLNTEFRLDRKSPILVETIENTENPYLFQIKNYTYIFDDATIYLSDGTNDISGELFVYLDEDKNFLFRTSQYHKIFDIKDYYTIIENIINVSDYDYSDNYLSFNLENDMTILTNDNFEYYIDISGSYYMLTNDNIYISDIILTIYDESFSNFTFDSSFNFKQINKENKEISSSDYNQLLDLSLNNDYNPIEINKYISLQYLSNNNEEIGNYIYYFYDSNLITDLNLVYKLEVEETIIDIFFIGKDNNYIYFSTVDKLDLVDKIYTFYSTDYSIKEKIYSSQIFFKCNCYLWGQINNTLQTDETTKEFIIGIEISEVQELIVFPNTLNANLYFIPFNTNKSNLDLHIMLKNNYYFPDELDYKRFFNTSVTVEETKEDIVWDKKTLKKIFKKIDFFMNDQKIDTLNEKIFDIIDMYHDKQKKINNIPQLNNSFYYLYIPLPFWFVNSAFNYLPLIALQDTNLLLKIQLNSLSELIKNDLSFTVSKLPDKININLLTDTILLGDKERKQFAEYNHEYIIERNISYSDVFINQVNKTITLPIKGLLKEIYWLFSSRDTGEYYLSNKIVDRDNYYDDYYTIRELYLKFLNNNRQYGDDILINYKKKFEIFDLITNIIEEKTDSIYNIVVNNTIFKNYNTEFLLYLYHYYLSYYDNYSDSYFQSDVDDSRIQLKLNKLFLYLSNNYKDSFITKKESPVKSIDFKVNGRSLQAEIDSKYFNNVVPYEKLKRYIDLGIYMYSFSLYPTLEQPSGELNFNILKNPTIELEMNQLVENENVILNTIVREYQILRIIGGIASLSWV